MAQYYFIGTALPPLSIGVKPELSFKELYDMLTLNVSPADLKKADDVVGKVIQKTVDLGIKDDTQFIILSEYGFNDVQTATPLNLKL